MIFAFVFIGMVLGITIGMCLAMWYMNSEIEEYEEEIANLKRLNEEQRDATRDYIDKLVLRNKELEKTYMN